MLFACSFGYPATGAGQTVAFNETGRVSKVVAGGETQQNVFDADGNLLLRTSTTTGVALFLGDTALTQAAGSSVVAGFRTYAGAEGKPVAQRSAKTGTAGSTLCWLFTTLEGTVDVQTDAATGATVQSFRDPFGAPVGTSAQGWADSGGYMNKQVAAVTRLTNVGARTYDPVLGKLLSVDPVIDTSLPQQNTGYTYSGNNPTTYSDPTGLKLDEGCGWLTCKKATAVGATTVAPSTCKWGSPGCRGASTIGAADGSRTGMVSACRAFNSTKCEKKDGYVLPFSTGMDEKQIKAKLALTDYYTSNWRKRFEANAMITANIISATLQSGGECAFSQANHIFVCSGSPLATRAGTTFGDAFLIKSGNVGRWVDGTSQANEAILAHEARHSAQWAAYGPADFAANYGRESLKSLGLAGDPGCANWFEFDAGPLEGGYTSNAGGACK